MNGATPQSYQNRFGKPVVNVVVLLLCLAAMTAIGEISVRLYLTAKNNRQQDGNRSSSQAMVFDEKYGWKAAGNFLFDGKKVDAAGKSYTAHISTATNGFRQFGDPGSNRLKLFFIGDSFTHALEVSDGKTYYSLLGHSLPKTEIFAYGCGGWGTLQELMLIEETIDIIKPDLIILQFCANDFIGNDFGLESESYVANNGMRRPYLMEDGRIEYKNPGHFERLFSDDLMETSKLLYYVNYKVNKVLAAYGEKRTVEKAIKTQGVTHPGFRRAVDITRALFSRMKKRAGEVPVYAFSVDREQPYYGEFVTAAAEARIRIITGVPERLSEYADRGLVVHSEDRAHLNELGHRCVADSLLRFLVENGIVGKGVSVGHPDGHSEALTAGGAS